MQTSNLRKVNPVFAWRRAPQSRALVAVACALGLVASTNLGAASPSAPSATTSVSGALGSPSLRGQTSAAPGSGLSQTLLDPLEAFRPQVRQKSPTLLEVKFEIAPQYYLYRDRLGLELSANAADPRATGASTGKLSVGATSAGNDKKPSSPAAARKLLMTMPSGKLIDDPTFGRVEVYEQSLVATATIKPSKDAPDGLAVTVFSQGCAAEGVCFPPQRFEFSLPPWRPKMGSPDAAAGAGSGGNWISPRTADTLGFGKRPSSAR